MTHRQPPIPKSVNSHRKSGIHSSLGVIHNPLKTVRRVLLPAVALSFAAGGISPSWAQTVPSHSGGLSASGTAQPEDQLTPPDEATPPLTPDHTPQGAVHISPEAGATNTLGTSGKDAGGNAAPQTQQEWIKRGQYVAAAADCAACHTVKESAPYAGGYAFELPIGTLYASNITPDKTHGIGAWTEAQFIRAIREGIRPDGASLYPAMPYPSYARMTEADLHALYVYFMQAVKPVAQPVKANDIPWPLSMRFPLTVWRWMFAPSPQNARQATQRPFADAQLARGAYLVEGPGHCGACHTERGIAMQEKALTAEDGAAYLAGGKAVDGWTPPSLRAEPLTGLGAWSVADITTFLKTGRNQRGSAFGNMDSAIHHGTQYLTEADLTAMARYLKSLPAAQPHQATWQPDAAATKALRSGGALTQGQRLYLDNCAACHRSNGAGYPSVFPPLANNPVVVNPAADSVIHIILEGSTVHGTQEAPSAFTMPGFASRLTDEQIASVASFIRHAWGNQASVVTDVDVRHMRARLSPAKTQTAPPSPALPPEKQAPLPTPHVRPESENGAEPPAAQSHQQAPSPRVGTSETTHSGPTGPE